jgi:hypothetical protein
MLSSLLEDRARRMSRREKKKAAQLGAALTFEI